MKFLAPGNTFPYFLHESGNELDYLIRTLGTTVDHYLEEHIFPIMEVMAPENTFPKYLHDCGNELDFLIRNPRYHSGELLGTTYFLVL